MKDRGGTLARDNPKKTSLKPPTPRKSAKVTATVHQTTSTLSADKVLPSHTTVLDMDDISVEDFQSYHNRQPTAHSCADNVSSPPPFSSHHDSDSDPFSSPSPAAHPSSPPNEPIFDLPSRTSSPDTSPQHSGSDDEISVLLSDYQNQSRLPSAKYHSSSPYTPLKIRPSGFRNPSSVRAMRDTTPPHYNLASPPLSTSSQQRYSGAQLPMPSRNGTPRSQRSPSKLSSPSKRAAAVKKEYPLVLLHVTLLPIPTLYTRTVMERVLPTHVLENWKLLREKITPTVLERGILIPHPREDYDLLEERLLESLELRMPRILKCGHFHLNEEEAAELDALAEEEQEDDEANDADICADCGRRVRDGRYGSGSGSRRWDIKLYAANGLMRAGAWGAAWREMERVDVEVCPFVTEEMKRDLEIAKEQEEAEEAIRRAEQELHELPIPSEETTKIEDQPRRTNGIDEARMREIYGDHAQEYIDGLHSPPSPAPPQQSMPSTAYSRSSTKTRRRAPAPTPAHQLPLSTLLRNYIVLLSRDPRNLAIALLSLLVLLLAMASRSSPATKGVAPAEYNDAAAPMMASYGVQGISSAIKTMESITPASSYSTPTTNVQAETSATESASKAQETPHVESDSVSETSGDQLERDAEKKEGEGNEGAASKVLKAVDGVLDMMGGDEMAD